MASDAALTRAIQSLGSTQVHRIAVELTEGLRNGTPEAGYPALRRLLERIESVASEPEAATAADQAPTMDAAAARADGLGEAEIDFLRLLHVWGGAARHDDLPARGIGAADVRRRCREAGMAAEDEAGWSLTPQGRAYWRRPAP